jgi:tetratricopeptide (TPR) repeat protein
MRRRLAGRESPQIHGDLEVARILGATAQRLWSLEAYAAARPLAERALALRAATPETPPSDLASSLYQVGDLRRATGDYAGAISFLRAAAALWEKTQGAESPEVATALHYLGVVALTIGDTGAARPLLERALAIRTKALGPTHELVATTLIARASLAAETGEWDTARRLIERAQSIWETTLGPRHAFVARSLTSLARLSALEGRSAEAERLLQRALDIRAREFGPEHYLVARSLTDIAALRAADGDDDAAAELLERALDLQRRALGPDHPEVATTLAALARLDERHDRGGLALGRALEAEGIARRWFLQSARDLTDGEALRYAARRTSGLDVALSILEDGGVPDDAVRRAATEVIRSRAVVLDAMARVRRRPDTGAPTPEGDPGASEVADALPPGSVLVAYARHRSTGRPGDARRDAYLALVFAPGSGTPRVVPLGDAAEIDRLVAGWRREISSDPRLRPLAESERAYADAGRRLREAIWDPLATGVAGARQVFLVPDGAINLVSFITLPEPDGTYLAERPPLLHYLSAERDVLADSSPAAPGAGALVVGGPDYDALAATAPGERSGVATAEAGSSAPLCPEFGAIQFEPLPGARAEAHDVRALWGGRGDVIQLIGPSASEAAIKRDAPGRRILHLATHAYFLPESCGMAPDAPVFPEGPAIVGDRPLLRAGLALAGANRRAPVGEPGGAQDGILTAEEIAALDLSGVEWAVLSACDTGVGNVLAGEGVVGLRRAFEAAGARTLIMSLWSVDDGAARVWMRSLYAGRRSGLSTAEAVAAASRAMLAAQRREGRTTHPYFWGAFVAAGDWR